MKKEALYLTLGIGVIALSEAAFTKKQRDAILERDGHKCQATCKHDHDPNHPLEVDHIIPQRYASSLHPPIDPDYPENALSKCRTGHDIKHPDRIPARQLYHQGQSQGVDTFKELFEERRKKLEKKEIYWNPDNDRTDTVRAVQLTQAAKKKGWSWPGKRNGNSK